VDLRATRRVVTERELRREGLPPATFGKPRSQELILAKTADRSVLGCINDRAFLCEVAISDAGGLARIDPGELNQALLPATEWQSAVDQDGAVQEDKHIAEITLCRAKTRHDPMESQVGGQQPRQRGGHGPVGPVRPRSGPGLAT
jgi:hypothetical protein